MDNVHLLGHEFRHVIGVTAQNMEYCWRPQAEYGATEKDAKRCPMEPIRGKTREVVDSQ